MSPGNLKLASAAPGIATGGKALILYSSGNGTTGTPDTKLHVVGDIKASGNITATGDITGANIPAWAVTATHNFLSQSITESTPLNTAGGDENYI